MPHGGRGADAVQARVAMPTRSESARAFYSEHATDVAKLDDRMRRLISACVRAAPGSVLDLGCGRGYLLRALRRELPGARCIGVEVSDSSVGELRAEGIEVHVQDVADRLPAQDASIDLVVLGEVIEHVFDPDACIEGIYRVLRPGGTLIVTTPNLASWLNRALLLFGVQPVFTETSTRKKYGHWLGLLGERTSNTQGHLKLFTLGALRELLVDLGFDIVRVEGYKFYLLAEHPLANLIESVFRLRPSLASGFIVTARKRADE